MSQIRIQTNKIELDGMLIDAGETITKNIIEDIFINNKNLLITGPGGVGKTVLIKLISKLSNMYNKKVAITATTGTAAVNIGALASTIHSWAGIGIADKDETYYYSRLKYLKEKMKIINDIDILIIDEVSMMGGNTFNILNKVLQLARTDRATAEDYCTLYKYMEEMNKEIKDNKDNIVNNSNNSNNSNNDTKVKKPQNYVIIEKKLNEIKNKLVPFGGIKLVLVGDMLQLEQINDIHISDSISWKEADVKIYKMNKSRRYDNTKWFDLLCRIRTGNQTKEDIDIINKRVKNREELKKLMNAKISPTILYSRRADVDYINNKKLSQIKSKLYKFKAVDDIPNKIKSKYMREKVKNILEKSVKEVLQLKVGAQVMYLKNDKVLNLVNGSKLVITKIEDGKIYVSGLDGYTRILYPVKFDIKFNNVEITRHQFALDLCYSITVHKSQGKTLDLVVADLGKSVFANGQLYTAISRVRDINGLYLTSFDKNSIKTNKELVKLFA